MRLEGKDVRLDDAAVCIFALSDNFFNDKRSLEHLKRAVKKGLTCILVVMPGARWGDKTFPENAFDSRSSPYVPEVKPAFAEIAVTWEDEFSHACAAELLKRVVAHLGKNAASIDVSAACLRLAEAEEEDLQKASSQATNRQTVAKGLDLDSKKFDVFLSHKIADAKDVVLTWYNALAALGYKPFLDRISLDAVEKIPEYVKQSMTVVIALSANYFESYWCAVELCTAVELHAQGQLNILLVPIQVLGRYCPLPSVTGRY